MTSKKDEDNEDIKMAIWNLVEQTDPGDTQHVGQRGGFTAISAHSQVKRATEVFGPIGQGWGYDCVFGFQDTGRELYVWCDLILWWTRTSDWEGMKVANRREFGPIRGMCKVQGVKADGKPTPSDHDASKKCMTDALTKGLSHLGFNADVFLGLFDDNKYVQGLSDEKTKEADAKAQLYEQDRKEFTDKVKKCTKPEDIDKVVADYKLWMGRLPESKQVQIMAWIGKTKEELEGNE